MFVGYLKVWYNMAINLSLGLPLMRTLLLLQSCRPLNICSSNLYLDLIMVSYYKIILIPDFPIYGSIVLANMQSASESSCVACQVWQMCLAEVVHLHLNGNKL